MKKLILLLFTKRKRETNKTSKRITKPSPIKELKSVTSSSPNPKVRIIVIDTNKSMIIDREVAIGLMHEQPNKYKIEEV